MWQVIDTEMLAKHLKKLSKVVTGGQSASARKIAVLMFTSICQSNKADFYYQDIIKNLLHDNYNAAPKDFADVMCIIYAMLDGLAGDYKYRGVYVLESHGKVYVAIKQKSS